MSRRDRGGAGRLRIVSGRWGGRRLESAPGSRPTQERVREALLSRWQPRLEGATVLELFCGSGVVGIEALGRGARQAFFVDRRIESLVRNLDLLEIGEAARVHRGELPRALRRLPESWPDRYDLVYADPPYEFEGHQGLLKAVAPLLDEAGELAIEHSSRRRLPERVTGKILLECAAERRYGHSLITFYRCSSASDGREAGDS